MCAEYVSKEYHFNNLITKGFCWNTLLNHVSSYRKRERGRAREEGGREGVVIFVGRHLIPQVTCPETNLLSRSTIKPPWNTVKEYQFHWLKA